jgi:hypothetical protein
MVTPVAPLVDQSSVVLIPGPTLAGLARKELIAGGFAGTTVAVVVAVADPKELVAVKVYKVVALGVTVAEFPVTAPTPGLMIMPGEPVTAQLSVLACPRVTFAGVAVKPLMVGGLPTRIEVEAVTAPKLLVAVRMYDVVVIGVTLTQAPVTAPTPELTFTLVAPVTAQASVPD